MRGEFFARMEYEERIPLYFAFRDSHCFLWLVLVFGGATGLSFLDRRGTQVFYCIKYLSFYTLFQLSVGSFAERL